MAAVNPAIHDTHHDAHDDHDHKPQGFLDRWLFTTNHKDIGTLYLVFSLVMFFTGGTMAMIVAYRPQWCASFDDARYLSRRD